MGRIPRRAFLAITVLSGACGGPSTEGRSANDLVFLTRDGCANTALMRGRLDEALSRMGLPLDYQVVDLATLPAADVRRGYPTPTLLYHDRDLFGMAVPKPPLPEPS